MKKVNNHLIRSAVKPCYDPLDVGMDDDFTEDIPTYIEKARSLAKNNRDILWVFCREDFLERKVINRFLLSCIRKAEKAAGEKRKYLKNAYESSKTNNNFQRVYDLACATICKETGRGREEVFNEFVDKLIEYFK